MLSCWNVIKYLGCLVHRTSHHSVFNHLQHTKTEREGPLYHVMYVSTEVDRWGRSPTTKRMTLSPFFGNVCSSIEPSNIRKVKNLLLILQDACTKCKVTLSLQLRKVILQRVGGHWCHKKSAPPIFGTPIPIFLGLRDSPFDLPLENWHPRVRTMTVIEAFPYSDVSS